MVFGKKKGLTGYYSSILLSNERQMNIMEKCRLLFDEQIEWGVKTVVQKDNFAYNDVGVRRQSHKDIRKTD